MDSPLDSFPSEDPSPSSSPPHSRRARIQQACDRYGISHAGLTLALVRTRRTISTFWVSIVALAHRVADVSARGARALTRGTRALAVTVARHAAAMERAIGRRTGVLVRALGAHARSAAGTLTQGIAGWRAQRPAWTARLRRPEAGFALARAAADAAPAAPAVRARSDLWVIAIAALTSAGVSLLTVWLWSPDLTAVGDPVAATSGVPEASALATPGAAAESPAAGTPAAAPAVPSVIDRSGVARAAAAAPSRLVVITQPAGARVTVDGVGWGDSPVTIRHLPPGARRIRVTKAGYRGEERVVRLDDAPAPTLRISLRRVADQRARASDPTDH